MHVTVGENPACACKFHGALSVTCIYAVDVAVAINYDRNLLPVVRLVVSGESPPFGTSSQEAKFVRDCSGCGP